ncbi:hypothetical protein NMY22_g18888 [Coprinellus aureogranulatus]|nr:hypothetical protein NMY22_g18888 [Coprinellus aureogranulatus]
MADMLSRLPPGIVYLARHAPRLAAPPVLTYLLLGVVANSYGGYDIPVWLCRAAITLSLPVAIVLQVQWQLYKDQRAASSLGAVLPPTIPDWIPGGLRILLGKGKGHSAGYPGTFSDHLLVCWQASTYYTQANV